MLYSVIKYSVPVHSITVMILVPGDVYLILSLSFCLVYLQTLLSGIFPVHQ